MAEKQRERPPRGGHDRLPIKVILPRQGKERAVQGGGGPATPFVAVDQKYRTRLRNEVVAIRAAVM